MLTLGIYRKSLGKSLLYEITIDNNEADVVIEWFEVAILDGLLRSLVQPQTKKHWHLYRKSASHKRGLEAQLEEMFGAMLVLPQA